MKIRDTPKRAILAVKNNILGVLDLIPITWENDCDLIDRGIRGIVTSSITILIKVKRDCALLFRRQMNS
jgi:hypothetical protein